MTKMKISLVCVAILVFGPGVVRGDFVGPYEMQNWSSSGITGGTTSISPNSGATDTADFGYNVNLGAGGVSFRQADFTAMAAATGIVTFDYTYAGFHAFFNANAQFQTLGDTIDTVEDFDPFGNFTVSGSATINITAGSQFGFRIGGSNFDSNSQIVGTLTITNFNAPAPVPEPSTFCLALFGMIGLAGCRRRRT